MDVEPISDQPILPKNKFCCCCYYFCLLLTQIYFVVRSQCEPNPCKNGGTCYDVGQGYECTCAKGFRGESCEGKLKFLHSVG